ncbi:MAG: serine/threonine-protein kinase [Thermodesulfobacteriota bacterium]
MEVNLNYWMAQLLILVFYIMTLVVYSRARNEYIGGKIGNAINLILMFLLVLFLSDIVDYFFIVLVPLGEDTILIIKILLRLVAICVLFFGGLRFFAGRTAPAEVIRQTVALGAARPAPPAAQKTVPAGDKTVVVGEKPKALPTLGRYEILGQLGRGAMGIVYKGRDPKLSRLTAIKTIRFSDEFDESQVETIKEHFYREAEVVAKLSHTNIVTIYDVGEDLDLSYLAMEYLEGENLEKYTAKENLLPIKKIIEIIVQVCDALAYAHHHDIIHRDIKPANIMMLKDGIVKVTDFGIARATTSTRTRTGIIKGTPYYMSPEQTQGKEITGQSDVFSLGVVFYQLLTGKLPFYGDNMAAIMYQTTSVEPEPPTTYNSTINKPALAILKRSLEKSPKDRYPDAGKMAEHLRLLSKKMEAGH